MAEEGTLVLHKKDKMGPDTELTQTVQGPNMPSEYDMSAMSLDQRSRTERLETLQERETQRIVFEASFGDSDFSSSESDISNEDDSDTNLDFFDNFSGVPSLDTISVETINSNSMQMVDEKGKTKQHPKDVGSFVDPLTGRYIEEKTEEKYGEIEEEHSETEDEDILGTEETSELIFSFAEDPDLTILLETPEKEFEVKLIDQTEDLNDFLMQDMIIEGIPSTTFDKEAFEQERLRNMVIEDTEKFLNKLINEAVAKSEYKHPRIILRERLDKIALMDEICQKLEELEMERKSRSYLNRKVIDYYKRKKSFHAFSEEPEEDVMPEIVKFNEATKKLDHVLATEDFIKDKYEMITNKLREEKIALQKDNLEKEREFETLVRTTLIKSNNIRLAVVVPELIEEISTFRKQVSEKRLKLIQIQHTRARLQQKIDDFENQFRMREYMSLQTETTELDKKIEERNAELEHSRRRCNTDIHAFSHTKEKIDILRLFTQMKKKALSVLQSNKKKVREKLVGLKVERTYLQKEIRELTLQTGLLSKPSLLSDYDSTMEQLNETKYRVSLLREQRSELIDKIRKFEKKYGQECLPNNVIKI